MKRLTRMSSVIALMMVLAGLPSAFATCAECVSGDDGMSYCKDPSVYTTYPGGEMDPCNVVERCFRFGGGQEHCFYTCIGSPCYYA